MRSFLAVSLVVALSGCLTASEPESLEVPSLPHSGSAMYLLDDGSGSILEVARAEMVGVDGRWGEGVAVSWYGSGSGSSPMHGVDLCGMPMWSWDPEAHGLVDFRLDAAAVPAFVALGGATLQVGSTDPLVRLAGSGEYGIAARAVDADTVEAWWGEDRDGHIAGRFGTWWFDYDGSPFPSRIRLDDHDAVSEWTRSDWTATGSTSCTGKSSDKTAPSMIQLAPLDVMEDPPFPLSLKASLQAALEDPLLERLQEFLSAHPEGFLQSWTYTTGTGPTSAGSWRLHMTAPGVDEEVVLSCRKSMGALPDALIKCTEGTEKRAAPAEAPDWNTAQIVSYDRSVEVFQRLHHKEPNGGTYGIEGSRLYGSLYHDLQSDQRQPTWQREQDLFDARTGQFMVMTGTPPVRSGGTTLSDGFA